MNKSQYRAMRKLIRANGKYALRWLKGQALEIADALYNCQADDKLAERQDVVKWCQSSGIAYNFRQIK